MRQFINGAKTAVSGKFVASVLSLLIIALGAKAGMNKDSLSKAVSETVAHAVRVSVRTDKVKYTMRESVQLDVVIRNEGDDSIYLDRRMFWGYGGGLSLDIRDQTGKEVPRRVRDDVIMPPPLKDDPMPLVRIDEARFFGATRLLGIQDFFLKPGKYAIRVKYKSWLYREDLEPRLRDLPVLWADDPAIVSDTIWIEVTP